MIPLSGGVLALAAVVSSPALVGAVDGTIPLDEAMTRYLIAVAICWVVLAIIADLAFPSPGSVRIPADDPADADPAQTER